MSNSHEKLQEQIRKMPLLDRLKQSRQRIGKMCSEQRGPKMTIPVQPTDDDIFISTTLADAAQEIERLQAKLLKPVRDDQRRNF